MSATAVRTRPEPRRAAARGPLTVSSIGAAPVFAVLASVGLILVALGNNAARNSSSGAELLFWAGLATIYAPITYRLLSPAPSRNERLALCVILGLGFFVVRILYSPLASSPYDELATWRQTDDLLRGGHPFTDNPLAAGYPAYPGLELFTAAIVKLTGLSIFHAGLIALGAGRLAVTLGLFLFLERVSGSARAAGAGIALYICNPSFLFFDSQFHHEGVALGLAAAYLLLTLRWTARETRGRGMVAAMVLLAASLTVTHHMTSYATALFLLTWTAVALLLRRRRESPGRPRPAPARSAWLTDAIPVLPTALMTALPLLWFTIVARTETTEELGGVLGGSLKGIVNLIFGSDAPKQLFSGNGPSNSFEARAMAFASVIVLLAVIGAGIWRVWRARQAPAIWWVLAGAALLYPATLAVRLTQAGTETAQRASAFVFVGLAFLAAYLYGRYAPPPNRLLRQGIAAGLALLGTVIFIGGVIIGKTPENRQPGPYLVGADARSIGPEGRAAARFAAEHLPRDSRVLVDRSNSTLLGSYGGLNPVQGEVEGVPNARVLFDPTFGPPDRLVLEKNEIDYVAVDRRLSRELPVLGFYFEPNEPGASTRTAPISRQALSKFNDVPGLSKIYANGIISIYDSTALQSP